MVWAIILAAGESRRMGRLKQLLPYGKTTIIETVVSTVIESKADNILVVLGSNAGKIKNKIRDYPLKIIVNAKFKKGMLSSVQCGFDNLPKDASAVLVILGDQPLIPCSVINKIIDSYKRSEKGIVLPVYKKRRGHPVLIDIRYREEIKQLNPNTGLRELLYQHSGDILEVKVSTPSILKDIDTAEDYKEQSF